MVEAARKYKRIVQAGTQARSDMGLREAFEWINKGNLGKILLGRAFCYKTRGSIGKVSGEQPIPAGIDYDLWCGPAPKGPLMRKSLHYDWHWVWPTGNGDLGNQGVHEVDMARWCLGHKTVAPRVLSFGGRFGYIDDAETPNTQVSFFDYKPFPIIHEVRGLYRKKGDKNMDHYRGVRIGVCIQCENGYYTGGFTGGWAYDNKGEKIQQFKQNGTELHGVNFIEAVRSRKISDQHCDILEGHLSSSLCHLSNISYRVGKQVKMEDVLEMIKGNKELVDSYERFKDHLAANEADFGQTPLVLGAALEFDAAAEKFTGPMSDQANALLRRQYREGYVLPENV